MSNYKDKLAPIAALTTVMKKNKCHEHIAATMGFEIIMMQVIVSISYCS